MDMNVQQKCVSVTLTELYPIDNDNAILLVTVYNPLNFGFDMTLRVSSEAVDRNLFTHIHANARTILGCLVDLRNNMDVTVEGKE